MSEESKEYIIDSLRSQLQDEKLRADRAQIEAHIAWECLARLREIFVKYKFNVTALQAYEPIKALEGAGLDKEITRRLKEKNTEKQGNGNGRDQSEFTST